MKHVALGIDIGGTNTKFGFVDRIGNTLLEDSTPTDTYENVGEYLDFLEEKIKKAQSKIEPTEIIGIGVGAPNGNYYTGNIEKATNLRWKGVVKFVELLNKKFPVPIKLTNDANAAAMGEMAYGEAKGMKDFIVITLGTGLGSGIVVNGGVVYGHDGFAGEMGHINVKYEGRQCGCGKKGCLEAYVSATGIKKTAFKLMADMHFTFDKSSLRSKSFNSLTAKDITMAANKGDKLAIKAFEHTGNILGTQMADAVAYFSPEAFFLFGGLTKAGEYIFKPTIQAMESNLLPIYKNKVKVLPSGLNNRNAAVLGAAALIWKEIEK